MQNNTLIEQYLTTDDVNVFQQSKAPSLVSAIWIFCKTNKLPIKRHQVLTAFSAELPAGKNCDQNLAQNIIDILGTLGIKAQLSDKSDFEVIKVFKRSIITIPKHIDDKFHLIKDNGNGTFAVHSASDNKSATHNKTTTSEKKITETQINAYLTEQFLLLDIDSLSANVNNNITGLYTLYQGIKGLPSAVLKIFTLSLIIQMFAFTLPLFAQLSIDYISPNKDFNLLLLATCGFLFVAAMDGLTKFLRGLYSNNLNVYLNSNMLSAIYEQLAHLPLSFFEKYQVGDIVSRFKTIEPLNEKVTHGVVNLIIDGLMVISTLVVMLIYAPGITLISIGFFLATTFVRYFFNGKIKKLQREAFEYYAKSSNYFIETFNNISQIRLNNKELERKKLWLNRHLKAISADDQRIKTSIAADSIAEFFSNFEMILVVAMAITYVINEQLTIGAMFAFLTYRTLFATHAANLVWGCFEMRVLSIYMERISPILNEHKVQYLPVSPGEEQLKENVIELEQVSVISHETDKAVLKDFSLTIPTNSRLLVTGKHNSGKTLLAKVIQGAIQTEQGKVLHNGTQINVLNLTSLNLFSSYYYGDKFFSSTVIENITMQEQSNTAKVIDLCKKLAIHEAITALKDGYNTVLSPTIKLNKSLETKILLARALFHNSKVLILDSFFNHQALLDDKAVITQLNNYDGTLIITHPEKLDILNFSQVLEL